MCDYYDSEDDLTQFVCWNYGRYESNSPAFNLMPELFVDLVREDPSYYIKKFSQVKNSVKNNRKFTDREGIHCSILEGFHQFQITVTLEG